jgi:segregation and condensation protein A
MVDPAENKPGPNPAGISRQERTIPEPETTQGKDPAGIPGGSSFPSESEPSDSSLQGVIEDPVEILVGLAERGEIDPWNINIIEVTDRFLSELERCRQLNLQVSGRTLFYAATLLRMKSEQLAFLAETLQEGGDDD